MREAFVPTLSSVPAAAVRESNNAATACHRDRCDQWQEAVLDAGGESKLRRGTQWMIERCQGQPCGLVAESSSRVVTPERNEFIDLSTTAAAVAVSEGVQYAQA